MQNFLSYNFFSSAFFIIIIAAITIRSTKLIIILCLFTAFMSYFYRYNKRDIIPIPNKYIVSPSEGRILEVDKKDGFYYISIFLSPLDQHYQLYPCNCMAISRIYDPSGKYEIVMNITKSRFNEKKIHLLQMYNGEIIKLTQIAGLLPRRISSDESINKKCKAGEYLGMIEFGSRVDIEIPSDNFMLRLGKKDIGKYIHYGDFIGSFI